MEKRKNIALKIFDNINNFNKFIDLISFKTKNWEIREEPYKERANKINSTPYWTVLKTLIETNNCTQKKPEDEEIISYLDTMYLMQKALNNLTYQKIKNETTIIMEYNIQTPSKQRIDYILTYRNSIILIEFSKENYTNNLNEKNNIKQNQLNNYKEQIIATTGISPTNIITLPIIYMPEISEENKQINNQNINFLTTTITRFFLKDKNAFELLTET